MYGSAATFANTSLLSMAAQGLPALGRAAWVPTRQTVYRPGLKVHSLPIMEPPTSLLQAGVGRALSRLLTQHTWAWGPAQPDPLPLHEGSLQGASSCLAVNHQVVWGPMPRLSEKIVVCRSLDVLQNLGGPPRGSHLGAGCGLQGLNPCGHCEHHCLLGARAAAGAFCTFCCLSDWIPHTTLSAAAAGRTHGPSALPSRPHTALPVSEDGFPPSASRSLGSSGKLPSCPVC